MSEPRTDAPSAARDRGAAPAIRYRAVELPSGSLLPTEARLGRRVLRTIDPASAEGRRLLAARRVELIRSS
ncbi:MAG: hypothetical protein OEQ13_14720 [Acidobacteriota bacterium]|nr:hypothetical protein [Acidobacteriota bacterium]